jgi:hypothetical protein
MYSNPEPVLLVGTTPTITVVGPEALPVLTFKVNWMAFCPFVLAL